MTRRRLVWLTVLFAIAGSVAWYLFGGRSVPPGQPPLLTLDVSSLSTLRQDFNRDGDKVRIVALLSPT
jgi:hypothetical protein